MFISGIRGGVMPRKAYPRHSVNLSGPVFKTLLQVIRAKEVTQGPHRAVFEQRFAQFIGVQHAIGVSSGRAGLFLGLSALGLEPEAEILLPSYTFHIVPQVIRACGYKPVFIDVDPHTYNLDISLIKKNITSRTQALLVTHIFGQPCDMEPIIEIAQAEGLRIIEDCAHACGARYKGRRVGSFGEFAIFSFGVGKNMPCFGGGMLVTNNAVLAKEVRNKMAGDNIPQRWLKEVLTTSFTYFCTRPKTFSYLVYPTMRLSDLLGIARFDREPGKEVVHEGETTSRFLLGLNNLQAAVGLCQLERVDRINQKATENAAIYSEELKGLKGIKIPTLIPMIEPSFLYYRLEVERRDDFRKELFRMGIDTSPDDMSACSILFQDYYGPKTSCPVAERLPDRIVEIPNNQYMTQEDLLYIAKCIREIAGRL
jgi:dTDP-4-amino-4,6-dideoxygalactose transaminase